MKRKLYVVIILFWTLIHHVQAQKAVNFKIFKANGHKTSYKKLLKKAAQADIVFFGEEHDNPIAHWFEIKLTKDLYKKTKGNIIMGAEMLETDNAQAYTDYLKGKITYKKLKKEARLWPNFKTDYKPLLDFAKEKNIRFVATNIPRRYASRVFHGGFKALDTISNKEKAWIAPLPIKYDSTLTSYVAMIKMEHVKYMPKKMQKNMPKAQAVKDATMAYNILKNYQKGNIFIHFNGSYHSNNKQGIVWYIKQKNPKLKIMTIDVETQEQLKKLNPKHLNKADFIIIVDQDMPRSY